MRKAFVSIGLLIAAAAVQPAVAAERCGSSSEIRAVSAAFATGQRGGPAAVKTCLGAEFTPHNWALLFASGARRV